ncbi:MAG: ABC transporter permease [Cyclobacteriaceae bacterium]
MLYNYLKIAFRNLLKQRFFSLINIIGLALSMSLSMILLLIINDHMSYDQHHHQKKDIYRVISFDLTDNGPFNGYASSPNQLGQYMADNYPAIKELVKVYSSRDIEAKANNKILEVELYFGSANYFDVFDFPIVEGNNNPITAPNTAAITTAQAERYFGNESPIGHTIEITDVGSFQITAVVDLTAKSHFNFDVLASYSSLPILANTNENLSRYDDWENVWMGYNYFLLEPTANKEELTTAMVKAAGENMDLDDDHDGYNFELQHINSISPGPLLGNMMTFSFPWIFIAFFGLLALIVLITAMINYTNLSIARSLSRAREVGVRKATGAHRWQIFHQFIIESLVTSLASLVLAIVMVHLLLPQINGLFLIGAAGISIEALPSIYLWFGFFALATGFFAGLAPAFFLSRFRAIEALHGGNVTKSTRSLPRKLLMVVQFFFSMVFIISILIIYQQTTFMVTADYGFDRENVLNVDVQGHDPELLLSELSKHHSVLSASLSSHSPASGRNHGTRFKHQLADELEISSNIFWVNHTYLDNMKLELIAGENFPDGSSQQHEKFILINESGVNEFGWKTPSSALGEVVYDGDSTALTVLGVVKDYHHQPMLNEIQALVLRYNPERLNYVNLRLAGGSITESISEIETIWQSIDSERPFKYRFLTDEMGDIFSGFTDLIAILTYITVVAIVIAIIGLLGMATFTAKTRLKEISIRKVLGAEVIHLIWVLSRSFSYLILLSVVLAAPTAVFLNSLWLDEVAYRIEIKPLWILSTALGLLAVGLLTVVSQTWKAAQTNPTVLLRSE